MTSASNVLPPLLLPLLLLLTVGTVKYVVCCLCQGTAEQGIQKTSDATKALPDAMTAALAAALEKADLPSRLPFADQVDGQPAFQVSSLTSESQQQLRLLVSQELAQAVQQINSAQVCSSN